MNNINNYLWGLNIYPKWGVASVIKVCIFVEYSPKWGNAALTMIPPKEWAMNVIEPN
jgi:hypothetical protein